MHLPTGHLSQAGPVVFTGLELFCGIVVKLCCKSVHIILVKAKHICKVERCCWSKDEQDGTVDL